MKVLVIGGSGQVGRAVVHAFAHTHVVDARRTPTSGDQLHVDLSDPATIDAALDATRPDVVVIAGAFTWVDGAEDDPATCRAVNVDGPTRIAAWCGANDATVVYYSSDHVFDGTDNPYGVDDHPNPLNVYAASKVAAEVALRTLAPKHIIVRTAWVYGPDPREMNFAIRLVRALQAGQPVKVPQDQWGTPTWAPDLARVTRELVEDAAFGTFHVVGPDYLSRLDLSQRVCRAFGLDPQLLVAIDTAQLAQRAKRPLRVRLETSPYHTIRGVDDGLASYAEYVASGEPHHG